MWYYAVAGVGCVSYYLYRTIFLSSGSEFQDNSIDAFIVQGDDGDGLEIELGDDIYTQTYTEPGKQVLVLYGTEYGFSEEVSKVLFDRILEMTNARQEELSPPIQPRLVNAKDSSIVDFAKEQVCLVVISTSGDGVPPTDARPFYDDILRGDRNWSHLSYSVLALGDSNYPQFCKTGRTLDSRLAELGCNRVIERRDIDMEDWSTVNDWMGKVLDYLATARLDTQQDYLVHTEKGDEGYTRTRPFLASLKVKRPLTVCESADDRETIHCEFDIAGSGLTWTSGDALGIYPTNCGVETDRLIAAMKRTGRETVDHPAGSYKLDTATIKGNNDLRSVLMTCYDLKTVRYELLQALKTNSLQGTQRTMIDSLLAAGAVKDNSQLQTYLSEREVADVLEDFSSHNLSPQQVLKCLKLIQPRYYSISSSPLTDSSTVVVTAAVVRYQTLGFPRTGVTTTFLSNRCHVGQLVPVFMSRNPDFRLPSNHTVPIILIGPGTGIAPFMAFIQERELHSSSGPVYLYFGCRHKQKDYLYQDQLERWEADGLINLRVAFSRDQKQKIYVQDLLLQDSEAIWRLIDKEMAHIYVCGDAKHMAHDVHRSLLQIAETQGGLDSAQAAQFLSGLEERSRYQKDVWVA